MHKLLKIYRDNINGIICTLIFHILLLAFAMNKKMEVKPVATKEEFVLLQAEEKPVEVPKEKKVIKQKQILKRETRSSSAVNDQHRAEATTDDPFFDQSYKDEIAEAERLMNKVSRQLESNSNSPSETNPEKPSVVKEKSNQKRNKKKTIYVGKSNIHYSLKGRFHIDLPIPIYLAQYGGVVRVDIVVNRAGKVVGAVLNKEESRYDDSSLTKYALDAARKTLFESSSTAPNRQNGYIIYTFVPQ